MPQKLKVLKPKKCGWCSMKAITVCDDGWPEDPCNAPTCAKHTHSVPVGDGKELDYCPKHIPKPSLVEKPIESTKETHDTPEYITELLIRSFGLNKFKEPNYRVIWGGNRVAWVHGELDLLYRHIPQRALNRWIIEKWLPVEEWWGPAETWDQTKQNGVWLLGPYPEHGEYEHVLTIEGMNDEFLQLTPALAQEIPSRIEKALQHRNPRLSRQYLYEAEAKKDEMYMRWADMIMDDNATWLATPHIYMPESIKEKIQ